MSESEILEKLIAAISHAEKKGLTRYEIALRAGIPQSTLSRLMTQERGSLRIETVERICTALGFTLYMRRVKQTRRRKA